MKRLRFAVVLSCAIVFLAACGGGGGAQKTGDEAPAAPKTQTVTLNIDQNDIYYGKTPDNATKPPTWEVAAGAKIKVNVKNNGALEHNWAIIKKDAKIPEPFIEADSKDIILAQTGLTAAGKTGSYDLTAPLPGEYKIICTVAGHYPSMQGKLIVK